MRLMEPHELFQFDIAKSIAVDEHERLALEHGTAALLQRLRRGSLLSQLVFVLTNRYQDASSTFALPGRAVDVHDRPTFTKLQEPHDRCITNPHSNNGTVPILPSCRDCGVGDRVKMFSGIAAPHSRRITIYSAG